MITYDYKTGLTLEQVNTLGSQGWEVLGVAIKSPAPYTYDVFIKKGFQDQVLIESGGGQSFWVKENVSYGESMIIIFITIFFFIFLGKMIFNNFFRHE